MTILLCEDSPDGILTAVYEAYASRLGHQNLSLELADGANYRLFADFRQVQTDGEKACKVASKVKKALGQETWRQIYQACLADSGEKADAIYRTIFLGLSYRNPRIMEVLSEPAVYTVFSLARKIANEAHRYLGFVRFQETDAGILYAQIAPEGQILPLMGDHFADRYPREHFLIEDLRHDTCLVHEAGKQWFLGRGLDLSGKEWEPSRREAEYVRLWRQFHSTVAIEERRNWNLQRQFLPLKFRVYMTENFGETPRKRKNEGLKKTGGNLGDQN